jgi:hypothetical protein
VSEASVSSGLDQVASVFDPMVVSIVGTEAARLAGNPGFSFADRDDIRQELLLDCFVRLRRSIRPNQAAALLYIASCDTE